MTEAEAAFVRGFVAAVAQTVRAETSAVYMLRSINATEELLREAGVDDFDLQPLLPLLRKL